MKALHLAAAHALLAASFVFTACGPVGPQDAASELANGFMEEGSGSENCTLTQGFWKNHEESWPTSDLTIGGVVYGQEELLDLLRTPTKGDASMILGHQLIASRLNVLQGAVAPVEVARALEGADAWMALHRDADGRLAFGVGDGDEGRDAAISFAETLAGFNEGSLGPGHCGDDPGGGDDGGGDDGGGDDGGGDDGGGDDGGGCTQVCGVGTTSVCPPDHDCVAGCCEAIIY